MNIHQWQKTENIEIDEKRMSVEGDGSVLSPVLAHPAVGVLRGGLIGGRLISEDGLSSAVATQPDDFQNLPSHWKDTKHEPSGIAFAHLEDPAAIAAARPFLFEEIIRGTIEIIIDDNTGAAILETEMDKLDACRILSLDFDKSGRTTCYDAMSGDALSLEIVAEARKLEV